MAEKNIITLHYRGRIAIITINRPERLNALSSNSYYLLAEKFREVEKREDVCITILTGTGRFFSA
jgi:peroxisomal 3,2-trans-enoyl-CoA isomerase